MGGGGKGEDPRELPANIEPLVVGRCGEGGGGKLKPEVGLGRRGGVAGADGGREDDAITATKGRLAACNGVAALADRGLGEGATG